MVVIVFSPSCAHFRHNGAAYFNSWPLCWYTNNLAQGCSPISRRTILLYSEGKTFVLCWRELKDVVRIQISTKPYKNNDGKRYKACTVFHCGKKGKQKNPEDGIISISNKPEWVSERLID